MMLGPFLRARELARSGAQQFGLALLFLGIFLERPSIFASSILTLLIATPLSQLASRIIKFKFELFVMFGLIAAQVVAESQFNSLILTIYLMGLINGILLPNPSAFAPRSLILFLLIFLALALLFTSGIPAQLGISTEESAFGNNTDEYQIDPRSLAYASFIFLLYLAPHFRGDIRTTLHSLLLLTIAALGANKFGMLYAALCKFAPKLVTPAMVFLFFVMALIGFASLEFTSARAALWADFFSHFPSCDSAYGVCTELIALNNEEGVRSFHSILLDFCWYGGFAGLLGGLYFLIRVATVQSNFGGSAAMLFAVALLFGFPPFFNERHVLIVYSLLILFQAERPRRLAHRSLRAHRPIPVP
jgi:hypothetical protein